MKKLILLTLTSIFLFSACEKEDNNSNSNLGNKNLNDFVTIWKTDNISENAPKYWGNEDLQDNQIIIPGFGINYNISWEEIGNPDNSGQEIATNTHKITFPKKGTYKISINGGSPAFRIFQFSSSDFHIKNAAKLISIEQWGNIEWLSFVDSFMYCENLKINAEDTPNLNNVDATLNMFMGCVSLNPDISEWDVSNVTNMKGMFAGCTNFNQDISNWNVSNVDDFSGMFAEATSFNQDISNWEVSKATKMSEMFSKTTEFNQNISRWDVSNVVDMAGMFFESNFNQNISTWNVSNVLTMHGMFSKSNFNQDISNWDVSKVTNMRNMFNGAKKFNQNITSWEVSNMFDCRGFAENSILNPLNIPNLPGDCY